MRSSAPSGQTSCWSDDDDDVAEQLASSTSISAASPSPSLRWKSSSGPLDDDAAVEDGRSSHGRTMDCDPAVRLRSSTAVVCATRGPDEPTRQSRMSAIRNDVVPAAPDDEVVASVQSSRFRTAASSLVGDRPSGGDADVVRRSQRVVGRGGRPERKFIIAACSLGIDDVIIVGTLGGGIKMAAW